MKVLVCSTNILSHVLPTVPLAWALRAAGHEVVYAAAHDALEVRSAGFPVVDIVPDSDVQAMISKLVRERPDLLELMMKGFSDLKAAAPGFAYHSSQLADATVAAAQQLAPDLIVYSQLDGAALIAAGKLGVPAVERRFGFHSTAGVAELLREYMADDFARYGTDLPERMISLDVTPPSLVREVSDAPEDAAGLWPMRCVPYDGGAVLPPWLIERPARPRIAVSFGTNAHQTHGFSVAARTAEAAAGVDAEFVFTLTQAEVAELGAVPANVRVSAWLPLHALLRTCSAVVHHGGAATTLTALHAGLPQLIVPFGGRDQQANASVVGDRGAALTASPEEIGTAVIERLLGDQALAQAAGEVRSEIAAMPSPAVIAGRLAELAG
jgi:UDP:flavonoid glycosyltransferase YjiC (YdhE family)